MDTIPFQLTLKQLLNWRKDSVRFPSARVCVRALFLSAGRKRTSEKELILSGRANETKRREKKKKEKAFDAHRVRLI